MNEKVSIRRCKTYDKKKVSAELDAGFTQLGGLSKIVRPGDEVLLKVNLIGAWKPERAVTTHPVVVEALCEIIKDAGGNPIIGDSSGGSSFGMTKRALRVSGMEEVARRTGAKIENFDLAEKVTLSDPENLRLLESITIAKPVLDADVVISVAKLKTHTGTLMTGAIKNMFGVVPGPRKAEIHRRFESMDLFCEALVEIFSTVVPDLAVMDGIVGMEGNGPSAGRPRNCGLLVLGQDCVAVDAVVAAACGLNPGKVGTIAAAEKRGLGTADLTRIDLLGATLDQVRMKDFKMPMTMGILHNERVPEPVRKILNKLMTKWTAPIPFVKSGLCINCGICVKGCPVDALALTDQRACIDMKKCISCFCCQELCPQHAVDVRVHWSWRLLNV